MIESANDYLQSEFIAAWLTDPQAKIKTPGFDKTEMTLADSTQFRAKSRYCCMWLISGLRFCFAGLAWQSGIELSNGLKSRVRCLASSDLQNRRERDSGLVCKVLRFSISELRKKRSDLISGGDFVFHAASVPHPARCCQPNTVRVWIYLPPTKTADPFRFFIARRERAFFRLETTSF